MKLQNASSPNAGDMFSYVIAEAWLNPKFAKALMEDKHATFKDFAEADGFELAEAHQIDAFELPLNPIGEADNRQLDKHQISMAGTTDPTFCTTSMSGCSTSNCHTSACSSNCFTSSCYSILCATANCNTTNCTTTNCHTFGGTYPRGILHNSVKDPARLLFIFRK